MEKEQKTYHTFWLSVLICSIYFLGSAAAHILLWTEQQFLLLASSMDPTLLSVSWGVCYIYVIKDTGAGHKVMQQPKK